MATTTQKRDQAEIREKPKNSWADRTGRHAVDALLRKNGFRIVSRKKGQEAVWRLGWDDHYPQSEVLKLLDWDSICDALYEEEMHLSAFDYAE